MLIVLIVLLSDLMFNFFTLLPPDTRADSVDRHFILKRISLLTKPPKATANDTSGLPDILRLSPESLGLLINSLMIGFFD